MTVESLEGAGEVEPVEYSDFGTDFVDREFICFQKPGSGGIPNLREILIRSTAGAFMKTADETVRSHAALRRHFFNAQRRTETIMNIIDHSIHPMIPVKFDQNFSGEFGYRRRGQSDGGGFPEQLICTPGAICQFPQQRGAFQFMVEKTGGAAELTHLEVKIKLPGFRVVAPGSDRPVRGEKIELEDRAFPEGTQFSFGER